METERGQRTVSAPDDQYVLVGIVQLPARAGAEGDGALSKALGAIDIAWVDPGSHTYALADRSNKSVDVIDTQTNEMRLLTADPAFAGAQVKGASGPSGVVIVEHKEVWASDGPASCTDLTNPNPSTCSISGSFKVIDLESGETKAVIYAKKLSETKPTVHGGVDEICYNPSSDVVVGASHAAAFGDKFLTFVKEDPKAHTYDIVGTIRLDGTNTENAYAPNVKPVNAVNGIEQCQPSKDGKFFYLAVPSLGVNNCTVANPLVCDGAVLRISGHAPFKVEAVFVIDSAKTGCLGPAGLTIGPAHQIGLGCQVTGRNSLIIDDRTGQTVTGGIVIGQGGTDEMWYDPGSNHYFFGRAVAGVMGVEDAGPPPTADFDVATAVNSKDPAVDPHKNNVYLPILGGASTICGKFGGDNTKGCIAIYHPPSDKDDCLAEGEAVIAVNEEGDPEHRKVRCDRN